MYIKHQPWIREFARPMSADTTWVSFYEPAYAECSRTGNALVADFLAARE